MNTLRISGMGFALTAICTLSWGCSAAGDVTESRGSASQDINPGLCGQAVAKDILIAQLFQDSARTGYSLTNLSTDVNGSVIGVEAPDAIAGDLEVINSVPEARDSVSRALAKLTDLPPYFVTGLGPDSYACAGIPAWTPNGVATVDTTSNEVFIAETNHDSWVKVQKEFSKECPLIKRLGNKDVIDPPGDGSTNMPPSETVSSTGSTANAFGLCPAGTTVGSYCKLSYATGVNYSGRSCQLYYGSLRCLLY